MFRFFAVHTDTGLSETWSLGINKVELSDQGTYQCQVVQGVQKKKQILFSSNMVKY